MTREQEKAYIDRLVIVDGHEYRILSLGVQREDGTVYAHLASTTEFRQQRNGKVPRQTCDYIDLTTVK